MFDNNLEEISYQSFGGYDLETQVLKTFKTSSGQTGAVGLYRDTSNTVYGFLWELDSSYVPTKEIAIYSKDHPESYFLTIAGAYQDSQTKDYLLATNDMYAGNGDSQAGFIRVDSSGNILHRRLYLANPNRFSGIYGIEAVHANKFLLYGGESKEVGGPGTPTDFRLMILEVDSVGNLLDEWTSSIDEQYGYIRDLQLLDNGELLLAGSVRVSLVTNPTEVHNFYQRPALIKLDADKNIVWTDTAYFDLEANSGYDHFVGVSSTPDDNGYVTGGNTSVLNQDETRSITFPVLHHTDLDGNTVWSRRYAVNDHYRTTYRIYDFDPTPDGGYMLTGEVQFWLQDSVPLQQAYLLKTDAFGCVVPGCELISTNRLPAEAPPFAIKTYPNPVHDRLNLFIKTEPGAGQHYWELFDAQGRSVRRATGTSNEMSYLIQVDGLVAGVYQLRVMVDGRFRTERVVIL